MPKGTKLERALAAAVRDLAAEGKRFALVGGLAVSVRAEVRDGLERETIGRATNVSLPLIGELPIARAEELLSLASQTSQQSSRS
jgi:hypothetical protein